MQRRYLSPLRLQLTDGKARQIPTKPADSTAKPPGHEGKIDPSSCARARAYDFGKIIRKKAKGQNQQAAVRVVCGARRHRDGQLCEAKSEPGKRRCRFHGGRSTGPRTAEGKARALANLRRGRSLL